MRAQVDRRCVPDGTCERGAAAWERLPCAAAFPEGVVRACARQGARARDGARAQIAALSAWQMERTGPCQRERGAGRRSCPHPARERVQGPGRGDRGTDCGAASHAPPRWSGRPCGRSLRKCCGPAEGGATARAPAGPQPRCAAHSRCLRVAGLSALDHVLGLGKPRLDGLSTPPCRDHQFAQHGQARAVQVVKDLAHGHVAASAPQRPRHQQQQALAARQWPAAVFCQIPGQHRRSRVGPQLGQPSSSTECPAHPRKLRL